jgi:hypothetical protein
MPKYKIVSKTSKLEYIESISLFKLKVILEDDLGEHIGGNIYNKSEQFLLSSFDKGSYIEAEIKNTKGGNTVNVLLINLVGGNKDAKNNVIYQF